jgi:hypothetical protein
MPDPLRMPGLDVAIFVERTTEGMGSPTAS